MDSFNEKLSTYFPVIAITLSLIAFYFPTPFISCKQLIIPCLGMIMLLMGLTLKGDDFKNLLHKKGAIIVGVLIQFIVMPFAAFIISKIFSAPPTQLLGMVLVGASAGGTASNVICYLAKGDLALSVSMTSISTILAVFLMPFLTKFYAGEMIDVPVLKMLISLIKIVLVPLFTGMLLNRFFNNQLEKIKSIIPFSTIMLISFIIAIIAALNKGNILNSGVIIYFMVVIHNITGLTLGYFISRLFKYDIKTARTIAIEVGMQNSGLSVAMAMKHFTAAAALPGAIFSIWHNVTGSVLAARWSRNKDF